MTITKAIDHLFNNSLSDIIGTDFTSSTPSVNIIEKDDHYQLLVAAPGLNKEDFNLTIDKDHLIVSASNNSQENEDNKETGIIRREFSYTSFKRSFYLPDTIDQSSIKASYKDGILNINLSKKDEAKAISKVIEIN